MTTNPLLQADFYKMSHHIMYPKGTTKIYSNFTPRKSRLKGISSITVFGIQYLLKEYLIEQWNKNFFWMDHDTVIRRYKRMMDFTLGKDSISTEHISKLHALQYLPLEIKALEEGAECPIGVPCMTVTNTKDHAYWLVNYLETLLSCSLWQAMTSATIAREYRNLLDKYSLETTGSLDFVQWQGHDFSMRGMSSLESACMSGAGHLIYFSGTDCIPSIEFLENYYGASVEHELVGASVPATEHSVMCMGMKDDEVGTFDRLIDLYPSGILSVVSDTWDLWKVCTEYLPTLKEKILARNGKLVIRPDSGNPVDIICGERFAIYDEDDEEDTRRQLAEPKNRGVIQLLWDVFGGVINDQGYKVLDPHIGTIYGDSITLGRADEICQRLKAKGFASTNIVFGIGSYTYQYNTRDTFGFAMKATYGAVDRIGREIFKDPATDDGTKRSAKGLLRVNKGEDGKLYVKDQCTWEEEFGGELKTVFLNGVLTSETSIADIRLRSGK